MKRVTTESTVDIHRQKEWQERTTTFKMTNITKKEDPARISKSIYTEDRNRHRSGTQQLSSRYALQRNQ